MLALLLLLAALLVLLNAGLASTAGTACELAIVGGGPGGLYTAWRLAVDTKTMKPSDICVFERAERFGGRTFSLRGQGTKKDLVVDLGAYRFCRSPNATDCAGCEMCMPMMSNLIRGKLGFPTAPYQPGDGAHDEACLVKIVDEHGNNDGLARYTDAMHSASAAAGVRFFLTHEATSIDAPPPGIAEPFGLHIRCTANSFPVHEVPPCTAPGVVTAKKLLLNTPLLPTLRIVHNSPSLRPHFQNNKFPAFLRVPHAWRHIKLYVHYDWAWWRSLGHISGYFRFYGPTPGDNGHWDGTPECTGAMGPLQMCSSDTLPLEGRYHDGAIRCDDGNATGHDCRGFIEATYTSDGVHPSNVSFFEYYQSNTDPPFVHVNRNSTADGEELLSQVHERLITFHADQLKAAGLYEKALAQSPTNALLSMWDPKSPGFGAGTHGMNKAMIPGGAYAAGAAAGTVPAKTIKPFKTLDLFIANEAFHPADWGEGSLEMAENIVHKFFAVPPPRWISPETYNHIMFGAADAPPPAPGPPPGPPPAPGPPPPPGPPPAPAKKCPAQTTLNATTVCGESVDMMTCSINFSCPNSQEHFVKVDFASIGTPGGKCGAYTTSASCHGVDATTQSIVGKLCLGKNKCSVAPNTNTLNPANPEICDGVVKHTNIQLSCGKGAPEPPSPSPPPSPTPINNASKCTGPFGADLPSLLQNRPSGTKVPDFMVMAAPFTPFFANGSINEAAVLPLAKLFKAKLGITAVWVMGMRGQFDTLTVDERKRVAAAWVAAGKITGLFAIIQCGSTSTEEAAEVAAYAESIGADAIASVGPFEELCSNTECVVDWVAPVAAAAPKTPFFYYHTPGWNGKSINGVKMYDWFKFAESKIPTSVGVKFESYDDAEFKQTCAEYGDTKVMIYAPCNSLGHWNQGTPGRGAFIQAFAGPMCNRIKAAYDKGDSVQMSKEVNFMKDCGNAGGNFVERYFYGGYGVTSADFGPPRLPQPRETTASLASMNATLHKCGFYDQHWP